MPRPVLLILLVCLLTAACSPTPESQTLPTLAIIPSSTPAPPQLELWQVEAGILDSPTDVDTWQFEAQSGARMTLKVIGQGDSQPTMKLQTSAGSMLAQGASIEALIPADGIYLVLVQSSATGSYEIGLGDASRPAFPTATDLPQVVGVPTPTPAYSNLGTYIGGIKGGEKITGQLTSLAPQQVYTYQGKAGSIITVGMMRTTDTIDPLLTLYSPDGDPLAMDDNSDGSQNAKLRNIELPEDGVYSLQLNGGGEVGNYTLELIEGAQTFTADPQLFPTASPTQPYITPTLGFSDGDNRLQNHVPVLGSLGRGGDFARYSFFADAGETVTVSVLPAATSGLRPMIEMFGPDGTVLASAKSSESQHAGGALLTRISIAESSVYLLIITGELNTFGDFVLSYGTGTSHTDMFRGDLRVDVQQEGYIQQKGVRDVWRLALGAGDVISAAVSPGSGNLDPVLEIYDVHDNRLYMDDNNGGGKSALIRSAHIDDAGIYTVRVSDASGTNIGVYSVVWHYVTAAPTLTAVPSGVTILAVEDTVAENQYGFYVFQGQQGQRVRIRVEAPSGTAMDPVAVLLGPDGSTLAQNDDSGETKNADFIATLPDDGTYSVRVNGYLSGGDFELTITLLDA